MLLLFVLIVSVHGWAECASDGEYCHINTADLYLDSKTEIDLNGHVLVRYGADGQWSYRYFTKLNAVYCHSSNFGYFTTSSTRMCYFVHPGYYYGYGAYSILSIGDYVPYTFNDIHRIDYLDGMLTTNVMGRVSCRTELFYLQPVDYQSGSLHTHTNKYCNYYFSNVTAEYTTWKFCATEGKRCYLPNNYNIYSIGFGSGGAEIAKYNSYNAVVIREFSGSSLLCSTAFFPAVDNYETTYPSNSRVCLYAIRKQFNDIRGFWNNVASCNGCRIQETLTIGVSSTNTQATSETWTSSFVESSNNGFKFGLFSNSETLSKTQTHAVMLSSSNSLSQMASKSFTASCGGETDQRYLYQWMLSANENCESDFHCKTSVYTANFVCRTKVGPPKCIPTECADPECETCRSS